jgi:multidrug resistance efflux pump
MVQEGDSVGTSRTLAVIDGKELHATTHGIVVSLNNVPGQIVSSQNPVLKMIEPKELRLIGHIDEDKGLSEIIPGQQVIFTVDAFSSRQYQGIIDHIIPTAHQSDIVFSISDQREVRQFDVVARFNVDAYPELKNGMSAKMWVYK